jgi:hypothetical protein
VGELANSLLDPAANEPRRGVQMQMQMHSRPRFVRWFHTVLTGGTWADACLSTGQVVVYAEQRGLVSTITTQRRSD